MENINAVQTKVTVKRSRRFRSSFDLFRGDKKIEGGFFSKGAAQSAADAYNYPNAPCICPDAHNLHFSINCKARM